MRGDAGGYPLGNLALRCFFFTKCHRSVYDVGTRDFGRLAVVIKADDGDVVDKGMADEEALELGGGDLEALVLDQFLDAVGDEEDAVGVLIAHIPGFEVTVLGQDRFGGFRVVVVALENVGPFDPELAGLPRGNFGLARIHIFGRLVGQKSTDGPDRFVPVFPGLAQRVSRNGHVTLVRSHTWL